MRSQLLADTMDADYYTQLLHVFQAKPTGQLAKEIYVYCQDNGIEMPEDVAPNLSETLKGDVKSYNSRVDKNIEEKYLLLKMGEEIAQAFRKEKAAIYARYVVLLNTTPTQLHIWHLKQLQRDRKKQLSNSPLALKASRSG